MTFTAFLILCSYVVGVTWLLSKFVVPRIAAWLEALPARLSGGVAGDLFWFGVSIVILAWEVGSDTLRDLRRWCKWFFGGCLQMAWLVILAGVVYQIWLAAKLRQAAVACLDAFAEWLFTSASVEFAARCFAVAFALYLAAIVVTAWCSGAFEVCR